MSSIRDNLKSVRQRIAESARAAGRDPEEIKLVAVTKTFPPDIILDGIEAGISIIGENRVQEAWQKFPLIGQRVEWHLVGHLQTNKAKKAVEIFSLIQSVDSLKLAQEIGRWAGVRGKVQDVLVEVNTSGEPQKFGIDPEWLMGLLDQLAGVKNLQVLGLMTVGPLAGAVEDIRRSFAKLRRLFDDARKGNWPNVEMRYLSMGMSGDFELAIAEGANMVRIGSAIFGSRR